MKKIKYFAIIAASIFTLTSCTDIVEVDDLKAKENKPSTGAPTVDKVVLATDAEFPIERNEVFLGVKQIVSSLETIFETTRYR